MAIIYESLLEQAIPILGGIITTAFSVGMGMLVRYINRKMKNETLKESLWLIEDISRHVVAGLMQTEVNALKEVAADGKLSDDAKARLKATAMRELKKQTADGVLKLLAKAQVDIDSLLSSIIESQVRYEKSGE